MSLCVPPRDTVSVPIGDALQFSGFDLLLKALGTLARRTIASKTQDVFLYGRGTHTTETARGWLFSFRKNGACLRDTTVGARTAIT